MKLKCNLLQEEIDNLKSQLDVTHMKYETLQLENKKTIKMYRELRDKERHDVAKVAIIRLVVNM